VTTTRYGVGVRSAYELRPRLSASLEFTADRYDDRDRKSHTRRIYASPGLTYAMPYDLSVTVRYAFIDYYSPDFADDNRRVNRGVLELTKLF
jgi:uncharacterized protein (PEP-CTERM system associated)